MTRAPAMFVALSVTMVLFATPTRAQDADFKCRQTIANEFAKYVKAVTQVVQKCNEAQVKAGTGQNAPGGDIPGCDTAGKIAPAFTKMKDKITQNCDGKGITPGDVGWPGTCPNFEGGTCTNAITNGTGIATCLDCVAKAAITQAMDLYYLSLANPAGDAHLIKCQKTIGKEAAKFLVAKEKILTQCSKAVDKGKGTLPCPVPGDTKAGLKIAKAEAKKVSSICKACDTDSVDGISCTGQTFSPAQIGFSTTCPPVTVPNGGPACSASITTLNDLVKCVDCVTEFKVDCFDAASRPDQQSYPSECANAPMLGTCPTELTFTATPASLGRLDFGWSGELHDTTLPSDMRWTVAASCPGTQPDCGICTYSGPITNASGFQSKRCTGNTRTICATTSPDCTVAGGSCAFYLGTPWPVSGGGVAVCMTNHFNGSVSGTFNEVTGDTAGVAGLTERVYSAPTAAQPCPKCVGDGTANDGVRGGTCDSGQNATQTCDVNGTSPNVHFGATSLDCPPLNSGQIATLAIDFTNTSGTTSRTLSPASPNCRAAGFTGLKCFCDTCNNAAASPCASNADCAAVGASICGGKRCISGANNGAPCAANSECPGGSCNRLGQPTTPNACSDANCDTLQGGNDYECSAGPFEQFCEPTATFQGCVVDGDCAAYPGNLCTGGKNRECYPDNGIIGNSVNATGMPFAPVGHQGDGALAAEFCLTPTTSGSVNVVAGIPGLGRLELPVHVVDNGTL
jgi:hypothetical protein